MRQTGLFAPCRGFLPTSNGTTTVFNVPAPGAFNSTPLGINNEGEIVGYYSDPNGFHSFVRTWEGSSEQRSAQAVSADRAVT